MILVFHKKIRVIIDKFDTVQKIYVLLVDDHDCEREGCIHANNNKSPTVPLYVQYGPTSQDRNRPLSLAPNELPNQFASICEPSEDLEIATSIFIVLQ